MGLCCSTYWSQERRGPAKRVRDVGLTCRCACRRVLEEVSQLLHRKRISSPRGGTLHLLDALDGGLFLIPGNNLLHVRLWLLWLSLDFLLVAVQSAVELEARERQVEILV